MSQQTVSLILPLADAKRSARSGDKAIKLSMLIASRFAVPRGFVISADAYRSHLWASGAREFASAAAEAEDREKIRAAVISHAIPEDIRTEIARAYQRLSWQCGAADPKVAVRASSLEAGSEGVQFAGAYESYLNVSGQERLEIAVKRVWASLWSGAAAAHRSRLKSPSEPAMAVIVQEMVPALWTGTTATADSVSGNPLKVLISYRSTGKSLQAEASSRCELDLRDFSLSSRTDGSEPALDREVLKVTAEKALLAEDIVGGPVELEWAYDGERLWILQARLMERLPDYFPVDGTTAETEPLRRLTQEPISHLARDLLWNSSGAVRMESPHTLLLNGRVYARASSPEPPSGRAARWRFERKLVRAGLRELRVWSRKERRGLESERGDGKPIDVSKLDHRELSGAISDAADRARRSWEWIERADRLSHTFCQLLRETLADKPDGVRLFHRLLAGLKHPLVPWHVRLQDLGDRLAEQRARVEVPSNDWWLEFKRDVTQLAGEFGYAFLDNAEMCDLARWKSWTEDPEPLYRITAALAQCSRSRLAVLHAAAVEDSAGAAAEAQSHFGARGRARLRTLVKLARGWLTAAAEAEQDYAAACCRLRRLLREAGQRLAETGIISCADDVFSLQIRELRRMLESPHDDQRRLAAETICRRKHALWLESRLAAPAAVGMNGNGASSAQSDDVRESTVTLTGTPLGMGEAFGRALAVRSPAETSEMKEGDVLLLAAAKPVWSPFLTLASGVVSQEEAFGASLEIARDLGVPVVEGCADIILEISEDSRIVRIDGTSGKVSLQDRRAE